jgi:hypothetical protein
MRDFGLMDIARKQGREQHPVVAYLQLCADDGCLEPVRRARHQLLAQPHAGHSIADD